jgi:hypothetical protein
MHDQATAETGIAARREGGRLDSSGFRWPDEARRYRFGWRGRCNPGRQPGFFGRGLFSLTGFVFQRAKGGDLAVPARDLYAQLFRRRLGQFVPGALLDTLLVLEAADIEPVAGAGKGDIEQAAMFLQGFAFGRLLGGFDDIGASASDRGNSTPSS